MLSLYREIERLKKVAHRHKTLDNKYKKLKKLQKELDKDYSWRDVSDMEWRMAKECEVIGGYSKDWRSGK